MRVMLTVLCLTAGICEVCTKPSCQQGSFSTDDLEGIVSAMSRSKGVSPTVVLNRILRKIRQRERNEKSRETDDLQEMSIVELIGTKYQSPPPFWYPESGRPPNVQGKLHFPPVQPLPGVLSRKNQQLSRKFQRPSLPEHNVMTTGVFIAPGFASQSSSQLYPRPFYIPMQNLQPPPGVTIRVERGSLTEAVQVTLSPMMSIAEALRQAEDKFRALLDLPDQPVIAFSRSAVAECHVVAAFNGVPSDTRGYWKIKVSDRTEEVIYDSVCLPGKSEVSVKPGTTITLIYTMF